MDLTKNGKIPSVNDIMINLESEIGDVKDGKLDEKKGRIVFSGRGLQLKAVDLVLQASRLDPKMRSELKRRMIGAAETTPEVPALEHSPVEGATTK